MKSIRVRAPAKINLCLEVLNKRPDGFHDLRTVFQTISLFDTLGIRFIGARRTKIDIDSDIPNNLVVRAAHAVLDALKLNAELRFTLTKRIPMGAGLGGGSSDAAAVLRALPALAGKSLAIEKLMELAAALGSDVPFFLIGGCALGLGRGTELYPLPAPPAGLGLLVTPEIHVSTAAAYGALRRPSGPNATRYSAVQAVTLSLASRQDWSVHCVNDFERVVFEMHPQLGKIKQKLQRLGASPAMMTGSGSALFGIFGSVTDRDRAAASIPNSIPFTFVRRKVYQHGEQ